MTETTPILSISPRGLMLYKAAHNFLDSLFIRLYIDKEKKIICAKPCSEKARDAQKCFSIGKDGDIVPKLIEAPIFAEKLYQMMDWDTSCTYRVNGELKLLEDEIPALFFSLQDAYVSEMSFKVRFTDRMPIGATH